MCCLISGSNWSTVDPFKRAQNPHIPQNSVHTLKKGCGVEHVGVYKNHGTPKSSILKGFSIINHPFRGTPIFGNTHVFPASALSAQKFATRTLVEENYLGIQKPRLKAISCSFPNICHLLF